MMYDINNKKKNSVYIVHVYFTCVNSPCKKKS